MEDERITRLEIHQTIAFTLADLENIAVGIEEGEVTGGFIISMSADEAARLPKPLLARLALVLRVGE